MAEFKFKYISAGKDGSFWTAGAEDGTLYFFYGDAGYAGWMPSTVGKADVVAVVDYGEVWCVNKDHEIWHVVNALQEGGGTWTQVPTASGQADAKTISVGGADGSVWYADTHDGTLYRRDGSAWHKDPVGKAAVIAAISRDHLWVTNAAGQVFELAGGKWTQSSGASDAKTISAGADGTVWYGRSDGTLFWLEGGAWKSEPTGKAAVIAVAGKQTIYCVNAEGFAFARRSGDNWHKLVPSSPDGETWTYPVKSGDTLAIIAATQYHTNNWATVNGIVAQIAGLNGLADPSKIKAEEVLTMPAVPGM